MKIFEDGVEQKITSFAKKEPILNLGLVIDNTGSMRLDLEEIISASQLLIANLQEKDEAFLARFVSSDKVSLLRDWTSDKSLLNRTIDSIFIEGGISAVTDGLYFATEQILKRAKENNTRRFALVLISDCEDRDSFHKIEEVYKKLESTDIQVFVIAMTEQFSEGYIGKSPKESSEAFANEIAFKTGGTAYFPITKGKNIKLLAEIVKSLVLELRSQYLVGYTSTNQKRNKKVRKLTIQVADNAKGEKRQAIIREGFIVPKD